MHGNKKILALIPSRGGSKGLVNKNILPCAGKPLIQWTIDAALGSKYIDQTIVSTDSEVIAKVAATANAYVPFMRPQELAEDQSSMADVVHHALSWVKANQDDYEYIVLLQPTSPLRNNSHIDDALDYYFEHKQTEKDTLSSVYKVGGKFGWLMVQAAGKYGKFCFDVENNNPRRQSLGQYFLPNGAIYIASIKHFSGTFYSDNTLLFEMPELDSVDIDYAEDLKKAQARLE